MTPNRPPQQPKQKKSSSSSATKLPFGFKLPRATMRRDLLKPKQQGSSSSSSSLVGDGSLVAEKQPLVANSKQASQADEATPPRALPGPLQATKAADKGKKPASSPASAQLNSSYPLPPPVVSSSSPYVVSASSSSIAAVPAAGVGWSKGKPHTKRRPAGHIKRPRNAFILFRSHALQQNLIPRHEIGEQKRISEFVSQLWHNLSDQERSQWHAYAEREKEEHARLHPEYRYVPVGARGRPKLHVSTSTSSPASKPAAAAAATSSSPAPSTSAARATQPKTSAEQHVIESGADRLLKSLGRDGLDKEAVHRGRTQSRQERLRRLQAAADALAEIPPFRGMPSSAMHQQQQQQQQYPSVLQVPASLAPQQPALHALSIPASGLQTTKRRSSSVPLDFPLDASASTSAASESDFGDFFSDVDVSSPILHSAASDFAPTNCWPTLGGPQLQLQLNDGVQQAFGAWNYSSSSDAALSSFVQAERPHTSCGVVDWTAPAASFSQPQPFDTAPFQATGLPLLLTTPAMGGQGESMQMPISPRSTVFGQMAVPQSMAFLMPRPSTAGAAFPCSTTTSTTSSSGNGAYMMAPSPVEDNIFAYSVPANSVAGDMGTSQEPAAAAPTAAPSGDMLARRLSFFFNMAAEQAVLQSRRMSSSHSTSIYTTTTAAPPTTSTPDLLSSTSTTRLSSELDLMSDSCASSSLLSSFASQPLSPAFQAEKRQWLRQWRASLSLDSSVPEDFDVATATASADGIAPGDISLLPLFTNVTPHSAAVQPQLHPQQADSLDLSLFGIAPPAHIDLCHVDGSAVQSALEQSLALSSGYPTA